MIGMCSACMQQNANNCADQESDRMGKTQQPQHCCGEITASRWHMCSTDDRDSLVNLDPLSSTNAASTS